MRLPPLAFAALSYLALGCSAVLPGPSEPSFPGTGSSSYSAPSTPSAPGVPQHETVTAGIVVRPDLVCFPFALRTTAPDSEKAVAALRTAVDALGQRVGAATGGALKVRMRGFAIAPAGTTKKSGDGADELAATVDGAFELPLAEGLDYWARTRLVASIEGAIARETAASYGATSSKEAETPAPNAAPVVKASFSPAQPQVKEPEAYRARLVDQWVKRARIFADAAQSPAAPLLITDCATPGEIAQRSVSNEEVALSLSITCRIDSPRSDSPRSK